MTGTECGLFTYKSVPVIFEPPCNIQTLFLNKIQYTIDGESNFISTHAINLIYCKTKPDWAEGDLHNNGREGSLAARHLVSSLQSEPITKGWIKGTAMSGHKPSNSQLQSSWTVSIVFCLHSFLRYCQMTRETLLSFDNKGHTSTPS
jgi:hypothetical protein